MIVQNQIESLRSLSFLYSTATVRNIIKTNSLLSIKERVDKHRNVFQNSDSEVTFSNLLSQLYVQMTNNYCNEYLYKNVILNKCFIDKYGLEDTVLIDEFKIGKSVADIILLNGEIKIFEIKTDLDSLKRLDNQLADYQTIANKVNIVTTHKYVNELSQRYGRSPYGIIEFTKGELQEHKTAESNTNFLSHEAMFKAIRKEEYIDIVKSKFGILPAVPNTQIFQECLKLIKKIPLLEFQKLVIGQLKKRKIKNPDLLLGNQVPKELRFICHSLNLDKNQYQTLHNLLNTTI